MSATEITSTHTGGGPIHGGPDRLHINPRIGGVQLQKVDGPLLDRLCADLLDSGRKLGKQSPGLKPRTVRYIHSILSGALDYAVRQQRIVFNRRQRPRRW